MLPMTTAPTWVLLDRDDTINVGAPEPHYVTHPSSVRLLPGAARAVARLNAHGLPIAVVANQRGVALGLMTESDLAEVNQQVRRLLAEEAGGHVDHIFACTHHKGACRCRKPDIGLLEAAAAAVGLPLEEAVMIGDKETDVEAGRRVGAVTIRIARPGTRSAADLVVCSLEEAVAALLDGAPAPASMRRPGRD